jgi:penicillin-binding protein 1A
MGGHEPSGPHLEVSNRRSGGWTLKLLRSFIVMGLVGAVAGAATGIGAYIWFAQDLPPLENFEKMETYQPTRFEASDGQLVGQWSDGKQIAVRWDQLPRELILALMAAEDKTFFFHQGLDITGILRAVYTNLMAGKIAGGGSTITQQLAKRMVGTEKTIERKIREAILARRMEDLYTKKQIVTWYLNGNYYGSGAYGVQAAAQTFFGRDVWQLELHQMAMLIGVQPAPSQWNPHKNIATAREKMRHVLGNMRARDFIGDEELAMALEKGNGEGLGLRSRPDLFGDHVPYFTSEVRKRIEAAYGDPESETAMPIGLTVSMAVEPALQHRASRSLGRALEDLARRQGYPGALGQMTRDTFHARAKRWLPPEPAKQGNRMLAWVSEVRISDAEVELAPGVTARLQIDRTSWAGRYKSLPRLKSGKVDRKGKASFKPKLRDMRKALERGDVILVDVRGQWQGTRFADLVPIPLVEGALVSYPLLSGGADTMVGGWDFDRSEVQRALALRQTGSLIKPVFYSLAYDMGVPPSAHFSGESFHEGEYNPTGDKGTAGALLWDALTFSMNAMSLRVLRELKERLPSSKGQADLTRLREWGKKLGLGRALKGNPSEVLGADQTPLDMAKAMGVFAARGHAPSVPMIRKVVDTSGRILQEEMLPVDPHARLGDVIRAMWRTVLTPMKPVIAPSTAYLTMANLQEVVTRGTAKEAKKLGVQAGGKTGTLPYDVWFGGFTAHRVAVAWLGADRRERPLGKSEKVNKVYGGDTALPAWLSFMRGLNASRATRDLNEKPPKDILHLRIDSDTGLLARSEGVVIPHRRGASPTEFADDPLLEEDTQALEAEF